MATEGGGGGGTKSLKRASSLSILRRIYIFFVKKGGSRTRMCVCVCVCTIVFHIVGRDKLRYPRALNYARETINRDTGETVDVNKASCRVESVPSDVYTPAIRRSTLIEFSSDAPQPSRTRLWPTANPLTPRF